MRGLCGVLALALTGCKASPPTVPLPEGMQWARASADPVEWAKGWLVTAVRPPTSADRTTHILTVLRVPAGAPLKTTTDERGERSVVMPLGAVAARVEYSGSGDADAMPGAGWRVLDVRQFEWTAEGLRCVVFRPAGGALLGLRWTCGAQADEQAGRALGGLISAGLVDGPADVRIRSDVATRLAKLNACMACHQRSRPEDRRPSALVQRATDAERLFTLRGVLRDEDPVERYRPVDTNEGDPLMEPVCPGSEIDVDAGRCSDGLRARLRVDVRRGVSEGDRHVLQLCDSRRRLIALVDEQGKAAWRGLTSDCEARP